MADTLETLEIEVKHSATGAAGEISKVAEAISQLSHALNRSLITKLIDLSKAMKEVGGAGNPITLNSYAGSTINNIKESVSKKAQTAIKEANESVIGQLEFDSEKEGKVKNPLSDELQDSIKNADRLDVLMHKINSSVQKMHDAFTNGDEERAWREKEKAMNAYEQSLREIKKQNPEEADDNARAVVPQELQDFISNASQIDLLRHKIDDLHDAMQRAFAAGDTGKAYSIREKMIQVENALQKAEQAAQGTSNAVEKVGDSAKKSNGPLSNFVSSLKRIAFYRIIRSIIKSITQSLQEGLEWAYYYSKGIADAGEGGNRFAASMDRVKTASSVMKAQLGSAFISFLTAIEPILITLINLVTEAADAISQLFAALTGTTYIKASADGVANAFDKGAGSAKAFKNQLLGFDEINRLNEPSGGGGGNNGLQGVTGEVTEISERWQKVAERLKPIIEDIKGMFEGLRDVVIGILSGDFSLAFEGVAKIIENFGQIVDDVLNGIVIPIVDGLFENIEKGLTNLGKKLDEKFGTNGTFEKISENINKVLETMRTAIDEWLKSIGLGFEGLTKLIADIVRGDWSAAWEDAKRLMENPVGGIELKMGELAREIANSSADSAEAFSNNQETIRNEIAATAASSLQANATDGGISFMATIANAVKRITRLLGSGGTYAQGGWPSMGEVFIANEAGPEMVGTIGGRTAVATNNDIVEAIRQGVYDAVVAGNSGSGGDVKVQVFLDSREIKAGQQRLNMALGG